MNIESIVLWIIGLLVLFLITRELITWYWKINEIVSLLKKIEENTRPNIPSKIEKQTE